jgi:uncharacterized protein YndB with AHSA1/START domain
MTTADRIRRDFTLTWLLDAPPAQVFRAWTDPDHLGWYFNPDNPVPKDPIEVDLRVGGVWRQRMVIDEERDFFTGGIYREIVPGEKLVFAWGATDGWPKLDPDDLDESPQVVLLFRPDGDRTELILTVELPESLSDEAVQEWFSLGIRNGWRDTVDRLAAELARQGLLPSGYGA